jgi:hypothetical protein
MVRYQQKLVSKQNLINRFVDIGLELFAISAVLSYADGLIKGGKEKGNVLNLADLYCRQAKVRIKRWFRQISSNSDNLSNIIAKKIIADEYQWLENDIIK